MTTWINVTDKLPEKNTEVLVFFAGQRTLASTGQYTGSARDTEGWCYPEENNGWPYESDAVVTHWMPLPPPPDAAPADPMDWPLPCDVTVGHGTMSKGVKLRTLVARMKVLYEMATGANADEVASRTPQARAALAEKFLGPKDAP